mgnify:CR=1 FL=1|tara:strand:- start:265 stop:471 length:207 start_codon:yes stop_codon:yes gene_type:complete
MKSLRDQIIDCIQTNQFSCMHEFVIDDVFEMFYGENSEMAIDRVLYELRTETGTPKVVLDQLKIWKVQ